MKSKQGTILLAVILAAPAFAFADNVPGHSAGANKYVTFSEGFTSQQNSRGGSAECNFLSSAPKESVLSTSSIVGSYSTAISKGEKGSEFGSGQASSGNAVHLADFSGNNGASSDNDEGKGKGKGKQNGGSGDGNGAPAPLIAIAEPGSQSLLLFGLAGVGMLFYGRKLRTKAA